MIDLIESELPASKVASILKQTKLHRPIPPMDAPEWAAANLKPAVQKWMQTIRAVAETDASEPLPPLPDDLYALFYKTGERRPFETVYLERRRRLARIAMVVLMGDAVTRDKYTPALVEKIEGIMAEESWTFPAHAWTQPSGKDPFKIDLFAAETANLMGELLNLFGAIIPAELQDRIKRRLHEQIFKNYLEPRSEITWKGLPQNWNAVCHQGVIGAALALEDDLDLVAAILASAGKCLRIFLNGFGRDGSTSEGPGYWSYGFGRFAELNRQVETATGGALSFFGANEHIRRIAQFAPAMVFSNGYLINFSDGGRKGRLDPALLGYLGERLDLPLLREESAALFHCQAESGVDLEMHRCDVYYLTKLFLRCPATTEAADEPPRPDVFFEDYGAVVCRGTDARGNFLEFAAKAGHNAEHHNHNDCGSFILSLNGEPAILEIGAPEYVGDYFNSDRTRYQFLAARSLGHSVPLVNGCEQSPGAEFAAKVLGCELGAGNAKLIVDLTKCYPAQAGCRRLTRTFLFDKDLGRLEISDAFELEAPGEVRSMIICESPAFTDGLAATIKAGGGVLQIMPRGDAKFVGVESCGYRTHLAEDASVNRLIFAPDAPLQAGVIVCDIRVL